MLESIIDEVLNNSGNDCVTKKWLNTLSLEAQTKLAQVHEKDRSNPGSVDFSNLFKRLNQEVGVPFRLTSFRDHFRDRCTCRSK